MLPPLSRRSAYSIIRTMHNRHVGVTPQLAAQLAVLTREPAAVSEMEAPWKQVIERLTSELENRRNPNARHHAFGLVLSAAPSYSILRLAMPIVAEACKRIKLCFLFCEDEAGNVTAAAYRQYEQQLSSEIQRMAAEKDHFFQVFWKERALTLADYSRRHGERSYKGSSLPESDPSSTAMLMRLRPQVPAFKPRQRSAKQAFSRLKNRESLKYKEGGFNGIRVSMRAEDMEDILMSEFMNPPILLADRLINSGFLALKRKPKHEKLKDVLIVGLMPHQVKPRLNADFVKACWFDFISRFGLMLSSNRLMGSEFRWLEGDSLNRCRTCKYLLEDLPIPETFRESEQAKPSAAYRSGFLAALGWLPSFLDIRSRYQPLQYSQAGGGIGSDDLSPAMQWACAAWKDQSLLRSGKKTADIDTFSFVHVLLFLPAETRAPGAETENEPEPHLPPHANLARLHRGMNFPRLPGRSTMIVRVPQNLQDTAQWSVERPNQRDPRLFSTAPHQSAGKVSWETISGRLVQVWLEHLMEETWNG